MNLPLSISLARCFTAHDDVSFPSPEGRDGVDGRAVLTSWTCAGTCWNVELLNSRKGKKLSATSSLNKVSLHGRAQLSMPSLFTHSHAQKKKQTLKTHSGRCAEVTGVFSTLILHVWGEKDEHFVSAPSVPDTYSQFFHSQVHTLPFSVPWDHLASLEAGSWSEALATAWRVGGKRVCFSLAHSRMWVGNVPSNGCVLHFSLCLAAISMVQAFSGFWHHYCFPLYLVMSWLCPPPNSSVEALIPSNLRMGLNLETGSLKR